MTQIKHNNLLKIFFILFLTHCSSFSIEFIENSNNNHRILSKSNFKTWQEIEILREKPKKKIEIYGKLIIRKYSSSNNLKVSIKKKLFKNGFDGVWLKKIQKKEIHTSNIQTKHMNQVTNQYKNKQKMIIITGNVYKYKK